MFALLGVKDTIPVAPNAFSIEPHVAITDALNKKYANKLIRDKGLALSVYDLLTAEDGRVTWGNGLMYYKVQFRLLIFAPFVSEVMVGRITTSTNQYIRVSLGFFNDVYITANLLPPNSAYDPDEKRFFWISDDAEDGQHLTPTQLMNTVKSERLYIDEGEPIRFRIADLEWQDIKPTPHIATDAAATVDENAPPVDPIDKAPLKIFATIGESGLGVLSWWDTAQADGGEQYEQDEGGYAEGEYAEGGELGDEKEEGY